MAWSMKGRPGSDLDSNLARTARFDSVLDFEPPEDHGGVDVERGRAFSD
jgi:hypothetical protein